MTVEAVSPEKVYGLVVGIERYAAGPEWDLNGPARDALKFASWLLKRGVEPDNISLFLSPLDQKMELLDEAKEKELVPHEAFLNRIHDVVYDLQNKAETGKLLYVFWAGHGFITTVEQQTRHLFCADTDLKTRRNLDFDSLLLALKTSTRSTVFAKQVFFIDACANSIFQNFYTTISAKQSALRLATNGEQRKSEQFCFFAAAEYEIAINDAKAGTGQFSQAVLAELKDLPLFSDMKTLAESIKSRSRAEGQKELVYRYFQIGADQEVEDKIEREEIMTGTNSTPQPVAPITLSPRQMQLLQEALLSAFPQPADLEMLVKFYLEKDLSHISMAETMTARVFQLLRWVNAQSLIADLLNGALEMNPNNPKLLDFMKLL